MPLLLGSVLGSKWKNRATVKVFEFQSFCNLCHLRSIAAHRDHFVRHLSVRVSVCSVVTLSWQSRIAMFRKQRMHSSEYCHYFMLNFTVVYHVNVYLLTGCQELFELWCSVRKLLLWTLPPLWWYRERAVPLWTMWLMQVGTLVELVA